VVGHSGKPWAFLCLSEVGLLAPTEWQFTTQWRSWVPVISQGNGSSPKGGLVGYH
jgi:hypothetical protein